MKKGLFTELLEGVREGGAVLRGEKKPFRITTSEATEAKEMFGRSPRSAITKAEGSA